MALFTVDMTKRVYLSLLLKLSYLFDNKPVLRRICPEWANVDLFS